MKIQPITNFDFGAVRQMLYGFSDANFAELYNHMITHHGVIMQRAGGAVFADEDAGDLVIQYVTVLNQANLKQDIHDMVSYAYKRGLNFVTGYTKIRNKVLNSWYWSVGARPRTISNGVILWEYPVG